jgi:hypothetical protein
MNIARFSTVSVIMILTLAVAISPASAQGFPFPVPQSLEVTITPDGGTFDESSIPLLSLFGLGGFYVDIPAGSVTETITVNIALPSDIPQDIAALQAIEFTVDGVEGPFAFLHPVTISIPYPASVEDEELLSLGYWDADAGTWTEIDLPGSIVVDTDANLVSGQVIHFSTYGVVVEEPLPTGVAADAVPSGFEILPAYPNPFNPSTTIPYTLAEQGRVTVGIYNVLGQHVATLVDGVMPAGSFSAVWNSTTDSGERVTSGVYIVRLETAGHTSAGKLLLMK